MFNIFDVKTLINPRYNIYFKIVVDFRFVVFVVFRFVIEVKYKFRGAKWVF